MLTIHTSEIKSYALRRQNKKTPSDQLMAEVTVPVKVNEQFEIQTQSGGSDRPFEQFICQEVTEVCNKEGLFYAILAQGAF